MNKTNVLTLYRGTTVIPNPRNTRVLEADDRLLCFGKLDAMRGLVPHKTQSKRRPEIQLLDSSEVAVRLPIAIPQTKG